LPRLDFLREEIQRLKEDGLYNPIRTLRNPQGAWIVFNNAEVLNLSSNNYLGLANDPRLKEKVKEAIEKFGMGAGGGENHIRDDGIAWRA
jgi:glycine C-acetyltransferase